MEIGVDKSVTLKKPGKGEASTNDENANGGTILGYRRGNKIYQCPQHFLNAIPTYCHEVGHVMGDKMSYQSGLNKKDAPSVLSFDEIKSNDVRIELTSQELATMKDGVLNNPVVEMNPDLISICNKLLNTYFLNKYDSKQVKFYKVSQPELIALVEKNGSTTTEVEEGKLLLVNSREGRNSELSSLNTEVGCLHILENTLREYGLLSIFEQIIIPTNDVSVSHQRAQNIVARAHSRVGWRIPSMHDINNR